MKTSRDSRRGAQWLAAVIFISLQFGGVLCANAASDEPSATSVLEAANHAELAADAAADGVVRVALLDDRISRVIQAPGGFAAEHDAAAGDLYLHPLADRTVKATPDKPMAPVVLFVGSEKGFTYRLTLTPTAGGPAQILIRNPAATGGNEARKLAPPTATELRIAAIARLIRAVANRERLAGYVIETADVPIGKDGPGTGAAPAIIEIWRGPRFSAWVLNLGAGDGIPNDAEELAARLGSGVAAVWIVGPAAGSPAAGRFAASRTAVVVREESGR